MEVIMEMDKDLEDQANALTSCPICMDPFENPKVLPCQHTFCLPCITGHYEASNKQRVVAVSNFHCPTCRTICYVPRLGLSSLPTDFKVEQIRELMKAMAAVSVRGAEQSMASSNNQTGKTELGKRNSQQNDGAICAVCLCNGINKVASGFCVQCTKHFCSACSSSHCKKDLFSDHSILPISPASTDAGGWRCEDHQSEMAYYCERCSTPACMLCVTCSHEGHNVLGRAEALDSVRKKAKECGELMDAKAKEFDAKIEAIKRLKQEHSKSNREAEKCVKKTVKELELKLKELEKQAMSELKSEYDGKVQAMSAAEKSFHERQKVAKGLSGQLSDLSTNQNMKFTLTTFQGLEEKVNTELTSTCDIVQTLFEYSGFKPDIQVNIGNKETLIFTAEQRKAQIAFQKDPSANQSGNKTTSGGRFKGLRYSFRKTPKSPSTAATGGGTGSSTPLVPGTPVSNRSSAIIEPESGRTCTLKRQALVEQLERKLSSVAATTPSPERTLDSPSTRFNYQPPAATRPAAVPTAAPTRPIPTTIGIIRQTSANQSQTFMGRLLWKKEGFLKCRDCCFTVDGQIAAAEYDRNGKNKVKIFSATGDVLHTIESILIAEPWALCYNSTTSSLFITDHSRTTSSIKSIKISANRDVSSYKCDSAIDRPSGIAISSSSDVVLTETGKRKNKIGIYSISSGRLRRTREFGLKGDGEGEILEAPFITVNHEDQIVISDCESHHIKVFTMNGTQLLKFSACVSEGRDMMPQGVAVDQHNNIFVADQTAKGVCKFSPDGIQIGDVLKTQGMPWGLSYCTERKRLAVAVENGIEVFQL